MGLSLVFPTISWISLFRCLISNSTCPKLNLSLFLPKWTPLSVCLQYRNGNTIHLPHHTNQNWEVILEYFPLVLSPTSNCQWSPADSAFKLPLTFISFSIFILCINNHVIGEQRKFCFFFKLYNSQFHSPLSCWRPLFSLCFSEFDCSKYLMEVESYSICFVCVFSIMSRLIHVVGYVRIFFPVRAE